MVIGIEQILNEAPSNLENLVYPYLKERLRKSAGMLMV
jgi:hypothetical protein